MLLPCLNDLFNDAFDIPILRSNADIVMPLLSIYCFNLSMIIGINVEFSLLFICYLEMNLLCLRYNSSSYLHKCSEMQVKCKYAITYVLSK